MTITPIKRALISVSNKTDIIPFAQQLNQLGVEIVSTGGTSKMLLDAGILHKTVEDITGFPELLDGRVKTLHPKIHGAILGRRDEHQLEAMNHKIDWIDLVVVNFYPFEEMTRQNKELSFDDAIEYIDIGGPTMVRAAAKNFAWVGVVMDPADYSRVIAQLRELNGLDLEMRKSLAEKVFSWTSRYDASIYDYFVQKNQDRRDYPQHLTIQLEKYAELRYGENPHQRACAYQLQSRTGIFSAKQHQGKTLSYNNILDAEAAVSCVHEFFDNPACAIVKHANPCGVAMAKDIDTAFQKALKTDTLSAFGGIVALNRSCTKEIAEAVQNVFVEVIIAPAYEQDALKVLAMKPNLRVLEMPEQENERWEMKFVSGGMMFQEKDSQVLTENELKIVTRRKPEQREITAMIFAWRVLKHIKSNAILLAKNDVTIGIGAGQVSRVDAVDIAVRKAGDNIDACVLASDAFFPFRDSIDRISRTGIRAIVQPGGSVRDEEVISACNQYGIAMAFTGKRCFKH